MIPNRGSLTGFMRTYTRRLLTPAQGATFLDVKFGMDPRGVTNRVFDTIAGRRYFRRWLEQSLDGLRAAATVRVEEARAA